MNSIYRVTIAGAEAAAPRDGFIDNKTVEQYMAAGSTPTTYVLSTAKERGNARYDFLRQQLQIDATVYITDIETVGANANTAPTSFAFTAVVDRGDDVLFTRDELNNNAPLTGEAALKRWIARALIQSGHVFGDIYDPTPTTTPGNETPAARYGIRTLKLEVGPVAASLAAAEALITIGWDTEG